MTVTDRRKFNGRKPGTMPAREREQKAAAAIDSWLDPAIRAARVEKMRLAAVERWEKARNEVSP